MAKHRTDVGIYGQPVPQDWFQSLMEYIGTLASNFVISLQTSTSIQVVAGAGSLQAALGIEGKWRYNSATVTQAHPGGAAGQYDIYAIASANSFAPGGPTGEVDNTDYSFGLYIVAHNAALPGGLTWNGKAVAHSRLVGTLTWDGAAITDTRQSVGGGGVPLHAATHVAGAADALPWTTINGLGTLAARPAASSTNGGYIYFATDATGGTLYRSNGSAWVQLAVGLSQTPNAHETTHLPGGSDPLPWTTINGYGTLAARPAAAAANAGYTYYATDNATQYRSDGSAWASISAAGYGAGIILDFAGPEANIPANTVVADGRELSQTTYSAAYARIGNQWNTFAGLPAPAAGNFRVPDLRGRGTVGKNNMGAGPAITGAYVARVAAGTLASLIGEEYHTLTTGEMPSHQHGGSTGSEAAHTHSGTTGAGSAHSHGSGTLAFTGSAVTSGAGSAHSHGVGTLSFTGSAVTSGVGSAHSHGVTGAPAFSDPTHSHGGSTGTDSPDHSHQTQIVTAYSESGGLGLTGFATGSGYLSSYDGRINGTQTLGFNAGGASARHSHGISAGGTGITTGVGTLGTATEAAHTHSVTAAGTLSGSDASEASHTHSVTAAGTVSGSTATEASHTHAFTTGAGSSHLHSIPLEGGGGSHENVWPVAVVIKVMTLV